MAKEAGLLYATVAMATDYDCWREATEKVNVANVIKVFQENVKKITRLFIEVIPKIAEKNWDVEIDELNVRYMIFILLRVDNTHLTIIFCLENK